MDFGQNNYDWCNGGQWCGVYDELSENVGTVLLASTHTGCVYYNGHFVGEPNYDGDFEHIRFQLDQVKKEKMKPNNIYRCSRYGIHESVGMEQDCYRSLLRINFNTDTKIS